MSPEESDYYRARAEQEREAARNADEQYVAEIHLQLARHYEALAEEPGLRPELRMAG